ncbi:TPA: hypothetical protein JBB06_02770 [Legionella pneumophila subsp. pneumophila]|uniref:Ras-GEF domain-containing protein n=1 Tax=Legionella pneumophila (strain Lens) TaxID=297245 RepID=Q5WW10_LEGPL|nr:hypothetical protein [Legionella pneumophila]AOW51778.1 hypothetical protein BE841_04590 [Legionella pneumophila subsp. pneumophila]AOW54626.1 hypothetical protein BE842_04165 [Legionella pneumophila subsp. pneumophila]AOW57074.1 hypothetical protein BE843_01800 [Legionella pneumophila subsp. pneumophila]AOW59998.1 hypothetical protein BE844_01890 [Legionella pneumophila subsp. pneumophila]AOW62572.1 hypothetical protein BE845_00165 [Legionella pneumophila subsp. pneumophila]
MSHNYFRTCLTTKDNKFFWQKPLASERFDKLIADRKFQKSIAHSRKNQLMYSFIESKIASDYALLIDTKLREQLKQFTLDDFNDISGFERKEKSNSRQQSYFKLRQELEFFLKNDIQQHKSRPDAQLNAFRRWINISDLLLRHHCYEGFLLVFVNLQLIADKQLIDGLPVSVRNNYNQLCQLSSPIGNHSTLRHFMNTHQSESDFTPLFFTYHAIGALDESLESLKDKEVLLKKQLKHLNKKLNHLRRAVTPEVIDIIYEFLKNKQQIPKKMMERRGHLIQLLEEVGCVGKQLKQIQINVQEQLEQRANLVGLIIKEQKTTPRTIPDYLEKTHNIIQHRFNKQSIATVKLPNPLEPTTEKILSSSSLYKSKLLPNFWNRHGKSSSSYWEEVFTPSYLNNR